MFRVERALSKDRIFEIYLNELYWGRSAYGVAAGADAYFGKSLTDLTLDQVALLAALPRAPSWLSRNRGRAIEQRNVVIDRMLQAGAISETDAASAKQAPLLLRGDRSPHEEADGASLR